MSVYIIAEAGVNHNGSIVLAKKLIDVACECGANAIKFQTFKAEEVTSKFAEKALYQKENTSFNESQFDMIKKLELPFEDFKILKDYCLMKNIDFISTPDGSESLKVLVDLNVEKIKIGSTEITNLTFLDEIGRTGKEIILSTGMSNLGEVENAINIIKKTGNGNITLLHCTTDYPTRLEDVNLKAMVTMKDAFKLPIGFSDHTIGNVAAIAAVSLGAKFLEKHITLDTSFHGPDHVASTNPKDFKEYVKAIRDTEKLLGNGTKAPTERELLIMKNGRRSIVANVCLSKGTILESHMLAYKRPGTGIEPKFAGILIGRSLKRDIEKDELITWNDI